MKKLGLIGVAGCIALLYLWVIREAENVLLKQRKGILN